MQTASAGVLAVTTEHSFLYVDGTRVDRIFQDRVSRLALFRLQLQIKRLFDIVAAGLLLLLLAPLLITVFLLVHISSPGPSIFWQWRWGYNGRQFRLCKLRTMYVRQPAKVICEQSDEEKSR